MVYILINYFYLFVTLNIIVLIIWLSGTLNLIVRFSTSRGNVFLIITNITILAYFIGSAISYRPANVRYASFLYPLIFLSTSALLFTCSNKLFRFNKLQRIALPLIVMLILSVNILNIAGSFPFFAMSHNPLLPENKLVWSGWGQQGYLAADYLNGIIKNESDIPVVYSNYDGFREFYKYGSKVPHKRENPFKHNADFLVFYPEGSSFKCLDRIKYPEKMYSEYDKILFDYYRYEEKPVFVKYYNGVPIIKVVKRNLTYEENFIHKS